MFRAGLPTVMGATTVRADLLTVMGTTTIREDNGGSRITVTINVIIDDARDITSFHIQSGKACNSRLAGAFQSRHFEFAA